MRKKFNLLLIWVLLLVSLSGCGDMAGMIEQMEKLEQELEQVPGLDELESWLAGSSYEEKRAQLEKERESMKPLQLPVATKVPDGDMYEDGVHGYYYEQLTEHAQIWYQDIYEILIYHQVCVDLNPNYMLELGTDSIDYIFQCVLMDHPEIFYVDGYEFVEYTQGDILVSIEFSGSYDMNYAQMEEAGKVIQNYVEHCLAGIDRSASDYDKVKYVYEYLIEHTQYNLEIPFDQSIYSVCAYGESVCQGYAKMAQYLLNQLGVETTLVQGWAEGGESHIWNLVLVDGYYYYMDVTWGDSSYTDAGNAFENLTYDYLCVTTEELCKTHVIDNIAPVPVCDAMYSNYYVMEGAYFQSYDEARLQTLLEEAALKEEAFVALKCSDSQVFEEMCDSLFEQNEIFDFLPSGEETVSYLEDEAMLTLTILLEEE